VVGSFTTGAASTRIGKTLPDNWGRTVASFAEDVPCLLVRYADSITLNQAVSDMHRDSQGAH